MGYVFSVFLPIEKIEQADKISEKWAAELYRYVSTSGRHCSFVRTGWNKSKLGSAGAKESRSALV